MRNYRKKRRYGKVEMYLGNWKYFEFVFLSFFKIVKGKKYLFKSINQSIIISRFYHPFLLSEKFREIFLFSLHLFHLLRIKEVE